MQHPNSVAYRTTIAGLGISVITIANLSLMTPMSAIKACAFQASNNRACVHVLAQFPSVLPATAYIAIVVGLSISVMPPASAPPATPSSSALRAVPTATSEDEQAVSMASDGPFRPYRYDRRPAATHNRSQLQDRLRKARWQTEGSGVDSQQYIPRQEGISRPVLSSTGSLRLEVSPVQKRHTRRAEHCQSLPC